MNTGLYALPPCGALPCGRKSFHSLCCHPSRIVFTSCMDASACRSNRLGRIRHHEQPDLLLLLGDQICMDWACSARRG